MTVTIHVSGMGYYHGEDPDRMVNMPPDNGVGFHNWTGAQRNALVFGDWPRPIASRTNILGHLRRVIEHMDEGHIPAGTITVRHEEWT